MLTYPPPPETASFLFRAGQTACLLIHGFTSTPGEMRELGHHLARRGITIYAPLLPGHGTTPSDLCGLTWRDWYLAVTNALDELRETCDQVYVVGLSLGGTLALHLAAQRGDSISGVISISAPVLFPPGLAVLLRAMRTRSPYLRKPFRDIQDPVARSSHISYSSSPLDATASVIELARVVRGELRQITAPSLVIYAKRDHVVHPLNAHLIYAHLSSPSKRLVRLRRGFHIATVDRDKARLFRAVTRFVKGDNL